MSLRDVLTALCASLTLVVAAADTINGLDGLTLRARCKASRSGDFDLSDDFDGSNTFPGSKFKTQSSNVD